AYREVATLPLPDRPKVRRRIPWPSLSAVAAGMAGLAAGGLGVALVLRSATPEAALPAPDAVVASADPDPPPDLAPPPAARPHPVADRAKPRHGPAAPAPHPPRPAAR